jgi:DNA replication and repair protein RecF
VTVKGATLRDFRNYERAALELAPGLTVIVGPNGAGKSNLLEALYFGCTARSPRTSTERELVRRGAAVARVTVSTVEGDGTEHMLEVGFAPGEPKAACVDGAAIESVQSSTARPLVSVFMPDRLELVKGSPSGRRAHIDQLVAAVWPSRAETRAAYSRALAQRNALLARLRSSGGETGALAPWDAELAHRGAELMRNRGEALALLAPAFESRAAALGLPRPAAIAYRPRSRADDAEGLLEELCERRAADRERGFTVHGPHRDDILLSHGDEALRAYGSQGQQRTALLALLFAERDVLSDTRGRPPLMLLDDVMSELDAARRELLAGLLRSEGQGVITTTELAAVPGAGDHDIGVIEVADGRVMPMRSPEPAGA